MKLLTVTTCICALALSATAALAADPGVKCAAAKVAAAGKYEFCRLKVQAKAVKTNTAPDFTKCDAAFSAKWATVESAGGMACPTSGDEAAQQAELSGNTGRTATELSGQARFTDNGDGTVTDSQTGLTWEKKVKLDNVVDSANLHDADNRYAWAGHCSNNMSKTCQPTAAAATACTAGVEGTATGCAQCTGGDGSCSATDTAWTWLVALNGSSFASHSDWRLPKRDQLASLVDYTDTSYPAINVAFAGVHCGVTCTNIAATDCSCTDSDGYWSASTTAALPGSAWFVFFGDGYVYPLTETSLYDVRAVR